DFTLRLTVSRQKFDKNMKTSWTLPHIVAKVFLEWRMSKRIETLLSFLRRAAPGLAAAAAVGVPLFMGMLSTLAVHAQDPINSQKATVSQPRFEAADVHRSPSATNPYNYASGGVLRGERYELRKATMLDLIKTAWNVDADTVFGGPNWLELDRFDIYAKAPL